MGRFNSQMSIEKKIQVYQYPYQSRIQRRDIKSHKASHFALIKGTTHKEILTIMTFSTASHTALNCEKLTKDKNTVIGWEFNGLSKS